MSKNGDGEVFICMLIYMYLHSMTSISLTCCYIYFLILEFIRKKGKYCVKNTQNMLKEFKPPSSSIDDAIVSRDNCEEYCGIEENCWGCSIACQLGSCQWNAIPRCGKKEKWEGVIEGDITAKASFKTGDI